MDERVDQLRAAERRLQTARTAADADAPASLIDDRLVFTRFLGRLAGVFKREQFAARVRHTRTLVHTDESGWRLVAARVSPA